MMTFRKLSHFCSGLAVMLIVPLSHIIGQTRFHISDSVPDYSRYGFIDQCLAAIQRLELESRKIDTIWRDTIRFTPRSRGLQAEASVQAAKTCLRDVNVDTLPIRHLRIWTHAFLTADRDLDVDRLFRRVKSDTAIDSLIRNFVTEFSTYQHARPMRFENLKEMYQRGMNEIPKHPIFSDVWLDVLMADATAEFGDTIGATELKWKVVRRVEAFPDSIKLNLFYRNSLGAHAYDMLSQLSFEQSMDSLSRSNDAYLSHKRSLAYRIFSDSSMIGGDITGSVVPSPTADYWFSWAPDVTAGNTSGTVKRMPKDSVFSLPVKDKINLIVFLNGGCHEQSLRFHPSIGRPDPGGECWLVSSALRRLKSKFPEIEISVVSNTYGNIGNMLIRDPSEEANILADYLIGFYRIPGSLYVSKTEFIRLDNDDKRRVDLDGENAHRFVIGNLNLLAPGSVIALDRSGRIFYYGPVVRESEVFLEKRLSAVSKRAN